MIGNLDDETADVFHKLLKINRQFINLYKAFAKT